MIQSVALHSLACLENHNINALFGLTFGHCYNDSADAEA